MGLGETQVEDHSQMGCFVLALSLKLSILQKLPEPHLTHRPQSSSFLGLPYRILNMNPKKELLWGLWVKTPPHPQP